MSARRRASRPTQGRLREHRIEAEGEGWSQSCLLPLGSALDYQGQPVGRASASVKETRSLLNPVNYRIMPTLIARPTVMPAAGNKPKRIEEFIGRVNSGHGNVSVAHMESPQGWVEPGQRPDFEEITVVLGGTLRVEYEGGTMDVRGGQAVVTKRGEWVRYSSPSPGGAEYVAICLPAFSMETVNRDEK